jgi:hypothetical protein
LEFEKASSDPSLLEGVPNETLEMNLQYPFKSQAYKRQHVDVMKLNNTSI